MKILQFIALGGNNGIAPPLIAFVGDDDIAPPEILLLRLFKGGARVEAVTEAVAPFSIFLVSEDGSQTYVNCDLSSIS